MYPAGDLNLLLARKAVLRHRIAISRLQCQIAVAEVMRPLAWIDRALAMWRQLGPLTRLMTVPLGAWVLRLVTRRFRKMTALLRWGPLAMSLIRHFTGRRSEDRTGSARAA